VSDPPRPAAAPLPRPRPDPAADLNLPALALPYLAPPVPPAAWSGQPAEAGGPDAPPGRIVPTAPAPTGSPPSTGPAAPLPFGPPPLAPRTAPVRPATPPPRRPPTGTGNGAAADHRTTAISRIDLPSDVRPGSVVVPANGTAAGIPAGFAAPLGNGPVDRNGTLDHDDILGRNATGGRNGGADWHGGVGHAPAIAGGVPRPPVPGRPGVIPDGAPALPDSGPTGYQRTPPRLPPPVPRRTSAPRLPPPTYPAGVRPVPARSQPTLTPAAAAEVMQTAPDNVDDVGTASPRRMPGVRGIASWAAVIVVAVLVATALRVFVVESFWIPSASMEPTLHGCSGCNNDRVLVNKTSYRLHAVHRGDVVVFDRPPAVPDPDKYLIKRVVGLPGDVVSGHDGHVWIGSRPLTEPYLNPACGPQESFPAATVPAGKVFVMGDNRCDSFDSRMFGAVSESAVVGRAFLIVWPVAHRHWL
jgi:signal peptidase I